MAAADKTLVTVATYNEMENLPRLVEQIFRYVPQVDLLVIDDNSPDGTGAWCERRRAEEPRIACLHRPGKLGLGTATIAGMKYAIENGYRYVLNMDADFSHQPKYLPALLAGMEPAGAPPVDVMIGSRYVPGGGVEGWPLKRQLMSRGVNCYGGCCSACGRRIAAGPFAAIVRQHWRSSISTACGAAAIRSRRRFSGGSVASAPDWPRHRSSSSSVSTGCRKSTLAKRWRRCGFCSRSA